VKVFTIAIEQIIDNLSDISIVITKRLGPEEGDPIILCSIYVVNGRNRKAYGEKVQYFGSKRWKKLEDSMALPIKVMLSCKHASGKRREGKELPQRNGLAY